MLTEYQLVCYCAHNCCVDCEHSKQCEDFYHKKGRLPYTYFRPYRWKGSDSGKAVKENEKR